MAPVRLPVHHEAMASGPFDALSAARATYASAADAFLDLVAPVSLDRYAGPGLGEWDLRALVGHTGRSFVTVTTYLATRAERIAARSAGEYFTLVSRIAAADTSGAIHERGVAAGVALGDHPLEALRDSRAAAEEALDRLGDDDPVVETAGGGMRVSDYLPTRIFELTVHSLDIAAALGTTFEPPRDALAETLLIAADSALEQGLGADVVLALTGRRPLPEGSSVVP